jgi:hypothetical protein
VDVLATPVVCRVTVEFPVGVASQSWVPRPDLHREILRLIPKVL